MLNLHMIKRVNKWAKYRTRSKFEDKAIELLEMIKSKFEYEPKEKKISYVIPESSHKYLPDLVLDNGIVVELKGRMATPADRQKYIHIINSNPEIDLRFIFQNPKTPIYKGAKSNYADWATKNGIKWGTMADLAAWAKEIKK